MVEHYRNILSAYILRLTSRTLISRISLFGEEQVSGSLQAFPVHA
jgi:hypothetical protein